MEKKRKRQNRRLIFYFSLVEMMTWITIAGWGFIVPFLQETGLNSTQVGITIACNGLMGVIAPPFWGKLADKIQSARKVFILMLMGSAILWFCIPLAGKPPVASLALMSVILQVSMLFIRPLTALLDSWIMNVLSIHQDIEYGKIRVWGSIGSCLASSLMTACISSWGITFIFPAYLICAIPTVLLCLCYRGTEGVPVPKNKKEKHSIKALLYKKEYLFFLILLIAMNIPVNNGYIYTTYLLLEVNGELAMLGVFTGIRAACEIPCVLLCGKLLKRIDAGRLICVPAILMICEQFLYTMASSQLMILFIAPLGGMAYGFFIPCMVQYTSDLAPVGLEATAQSISASMYSMTGIVCNVLGGWLIGILGARHYYFSCGTILLLCFGIFIHSLQSRKNVVEKR